MNESKTSSRPYVNINGDHSIQLIKDIKRATLDSFPPYQEELIENILLNTNRISDEAKHIILSKDMSSDTSPFISTLLIFQSSIKRFRRCLLAYHYHRLGLILQYSKSPKSVHEYSRNDAGLFRNQNLTDIEKEFIQDYKDLLEEYSYNFTELRMFRSLCIPPKELFVQIRVIQYCGTIQTEHGVISLKPHTMHYVRLSDVEHLITKGLIVVV